MHLLFIGLAGGASSLPFPPRNAGVQDTALIYPKVEISCLTPSSDSGGSCAKRSLLIRHSENKIIGFAKKNVSKTPNLINKKEYTVL